PGPPSPRRPPCPIAGGPSAPRRADLNGDRCRDYTPGGDSLANGRLVAFEGLLLVLGRARALVRVSLVRLARQRQPHAGHAFDATRSAGPGDRHAGEGAGDLPVAVGGRGARLGALAALLDPLAHPGAPRLARDGLGGRQDDGAQDRREHLSDLAHESELHLLADV